MLLPKPQFDQNIVRDWLTQARRKCCVHCGLTARFHNRDLTKPHGEVLRCRDRDIRFLPRDCPAFVYERMNIDFDEALTLPYARSMVDS